MLRSARCFVFVCAFFVCPSPATKVTPVQKVIQLLENMLAKGKEEKNLEQKTYASFKQFCEDTGTEKARAIKEAETTIQKLKAELQKLTTDIGLLQKEIAHHDEEISVDTGDQKAATSVREMEKEDYEAAVKDLTETIDALGRATKVLQDQNYDRTQNFVQLSALQELPRITAEAKVAIGAFLAEGSTNPVKAPEASAYEFQSSGILDLFQKLTEKFEAELREREVKEADAQHAYEMLMVDKKNEIEQNTMARNSKQATKTKKQERLEDAEVELKDTRETMEADKKYKTDLDAICAQKASDFGARQNLRSDEIAAIAEAITILQGKAVTTAADRVAAQASTGASSLAQLSSEGRSSDKVVAWLQTRAAQLHSDMLSALAVRIGKDPFVKVRKMIQDLLARLEEQAAEEAEAKAFCDKEMADNEKTRKAKTLQVEKLVADSDILHAEEAHLKSELEELRAGIADLIKTMAEADALRAEEKAKNEQAVLDAEAGLKATSAALKILREFYAKAADATALVQGANPKIPKIFNTKYTGMQGENGGVVGMLEVIVSDFARLKQSTTADEVAAQNEYEKFTADSKADKKSKEKSVEDDEFALQDKRQAISLNDKDLQGTQGELKTALATYQSLKKQCVYEGVSFEKRTDQRTAELESLKEALRILEEGI